jgi:hypothetical protein
LLFKFAAVRRDFDGYRPAEACNFFANECHEGWYQVKAKENSLLPAVVGMATYGTDNIIIES